MKIKKFLSISIILLSLFFVTNSHQAFAYIDAECSSTNNWCTWGCIAGYQDNGSYTTWQCQDISTAGNCLTGSTVSCSYTKPKVNCVGSWSETSNCSVTACGQTGVNEQVYTITTAAEYGGNACSYSNGDTRLGSTSCSTPACAINGQCSSSHYSCTVGTSGSGEYSSTSSYYTWYCSGSNGGGSDYCVEYGACYPYSTSSGYNNSCVSSQNSCGQTQSNGTIQCNGTCSSTPPATTNGSACTGTNHKNSCGVGGGTSGTYDCSGSCITPVAPTTTNGSACTGTNHTNSCGVGGGTSGTYDCSGSCITPAAPATTNGSACTGTNHTNSCGIGGGTSGTYNCSGSCITPVAPANPSYYGQSCTGATSDSNSCGDTNAGGAGTYQCAGTTAQSNCSGSTGSTPDDPSYYGQACTGATSAPNACGQTKAGGAGTYQCAGTTAKSNCSGATGSIPAVTIPGGNTYSAACTSPGNICGQTQANGTWQCNGTCSSTAPANSSCLYTLTINKAGTGSGTVGGAGSYNYGNTATATASPATGSSFSGWSGNCNASGQVYIDGNKTCTATFLLMTGSLTPASSSCSIALNASSCNTTLTWSTTYPIATSAVTASGMTNVNGNSGSQAFTVPYSSRTFYLYNNGILLTQASATSSCTTNTHWGGSTCIPDAYTVSTSAGTGGSISPTSVSVNNGSTTTLTIAPLTGYSIASVSGCGGSLSGTSYTKTYTTSVITSACTVVASFNLIIGTITPASSFCVIPLNASSCNVTLSWSTTTTAPTNTSALVSSGMTNIIGNSGSQAFPIPYPSRTFYLYNIGFLSEATVTSSCTANTHWDGSICAIDTNTVSTSAGAGGSISPTSRVINYGATTTFTVTPNTGYSIGTVSGCSGSGTSTYTTGAITSACTVSATFTLNTHTLTVNKTGSGSGTVGGAGTYNYGTTQTATEAPSTGSIFSGWSGDCNSSGQVYINGNKVCTATFLLMTGSLTPASSSCSIALNASTCNTTLSWSTTNPVGTSAVTASGMTNVNGNSGNQAFTVPYSSRTFYLYNNGIQLASASATSSCTANTHWDGSICAIDTNTVSTSAGAGGSISPTSRVINYGSTTTFTITPDSSHVINSVTGCGGSLSGSTYTTGAITGACTVSASFNLMTGSLTPASSSCTIALNGSSCTTTLSWSTTNPVATSAVTASGMTNVNGNSGNQAFTVPYSSRTFYLYNNGILLTQASATSSCTANTHWDGSICAIDTNTVSTSAGAGGSISPTSRTVNYGSTTTFTVTPSTGYSVASVSGCSGSGTSTYTTGAITSACTVSATFTLNTHTLTVNKTGSGSGTVGGAGTYNYGTTQTATEAPSTGSIFSGWSGDCNSSGQVYINGNKVCTATFLLMTGSLTPASSSCSIALNASTCNTTLSWSTTNPVGTSAVTASGMTNVNGNSGNQAFTVPYSSRTFYLYNSSVLLAQASATSSCTTGTSWNGTKCAAPSGTLTASNCVIASGANSCNTNLTWSTTDPIGTSAVTTPTGITVATANASAGTSYVVNYSSRIFYLYNNNVELKNATATASCITGTTWDGAKCAPIIITFTSASGNIAYNTATTLNWSVANATSCTASGGWSGSKATSGSVSTGNLTAFTTFTLSCTGLNGTSGTASLSVIVQSFGTLTASNCTILPAQNKCNTNLVWNTYNPLATSAVTTPNSITVKSSNSSAGTPYSVDHGTRDFYLYNNGVLLAQATATASCEQFWDSLSGTCAVVPTLTSPTSSTVSALSAKVGGTITSLGTPASISERGVCYSSTMQNPAIENNGNGAVCGKDGNNTTDGSFMIHLVKILSPSTTYYYRGYATNIAGTGYSPQGSFTTLILPPEATVIEFKEIVNKTQIEFGESVNLTWNSTNAYYGCTMTSNFAPATNIISSLEPNTKIGSISLKPLKTTVYTLICSGEGGTSPASQVQIKVGKINPTYNEF